MFLPTYKIYQYNSTDLEAVYFIFNRGVLETPKIKLFWNKNYSMIELSVSPLTGKKSKSKKSTVVKGYMLICDRIVSLNDFKILATSESDFHVKVKESLLISRDEPILTKNEMSLPLYLFDWSLPCEIIF